MTRLKIAVANKEKLQTIIHATAQNNDSEEEQGPLFSGLVQIVDPLNNTIVGITWRVSVYNAIPPPPPEDFQV